MTLRKYFAVLMAFGLMTIGGAQASEIQFNGFGSVYGGKSLTNGIYPTYLGDNKVNFAPLSLFGLNAGSKLNDEWQVSSQLVADGAMLTNSQLGPFWNTFVNWVFLTYTPTAAQGLEFKFGRQLFPAWLASEYVNVGFLQPYRRIPNNVFTLSSFKAFDGISISYTTPMGAEGLKGIATVFGGRAQSNSVGPTAAFNFEATNLMGASLAAHGDGYKVRAMLARYHIAGNGIAPYFTGSTYLSVPYLTSAAADAINMTIGGSFDKHNVVLWGEFGKITSGSGTSTASLGQFLKSLYGGYFLAGYRFGNFMPRYTYSYSDWKLSGIAPSSARTHGIGFNYQASSQAVLKAEYELFLTPSGDSGAPTGTTRMAGSTATRGSGVTVGIDFIF